MKSRVLLLSFTVLLCQAFASEVVVGLSKDPAELLRDAEELLKSGKEAGAVERLREILLRHEDAKEKTKAEDLLARHGYGLNFRVTFDKKKGLAKIDVRLPDVVKEVTRIRAQLQGFFGQVFPSGKPPHFDIVFLDSLARYRSRYPHVTRRSVWLPARAGRDGEGSPAGRIAVFHDARIGNRQDAIQALYVSLARALARALLVTSVSEPLPPCLEVGVSDYLAVRLFSQTYSSISRRPEEILQAYAREGLQRVQPFRDFGKYLFGRGPARKAAPRVLQQWVGHSYAVVDFLINGASGSTEDGVESRPRNREFQVFLRDFSLVSGKKKRRARETAALFDKLLRSHFHLDLKKFHAHLTAHIRGYTARRPPYKGLEEI